MAEKQQKNRGGTAIWVSHNPFRTSQQSTSWYDDSSPYSFDLSTSGAHEASDNSQVYLNRIYSSGDLDFDPLETSSSTASLDKYGYLAPSMMVYPEQSIPTDYTPVAVKYKHTRYPCTNPGCESDFGREADLKRHRASVHPEKRIECPHKWCGRTGPYGFVRRNHFNEHLREVHKQSSPKASNKRTSGNGTTDSGQTRYLCLWSGCSSEFRRVTDLNRHYSAVHGEARIDCPHKWCGRTAAHGFSRKDHFNEHLREVHKQTIPKVSNRKNSGGKKEETARSNDVTVRINTEV